MAAEPKTKQTTANVAAFLNTAAKGAGDTRLADCQWLVTLMEKVTKDKAALWGPNIVGCGSAPVVYADGRTLEWPAAAFSPRKPAIVIYGTRGAPNHAALLKKLGKAKLAGGCLYIKSLADVDTKVLDEMITSSVKAKAAKAAKAKR